MPQPELRFVFFVNTFFKILLTLSTGATAQCYDGDFVCPKERQDEFPLQLADLNDCNFFHTCYSLQKSHRDSCGPEAHFNGQMCVEGLCPTAIPGCQPQEPVGSTPSTPCNQTVGKFECPIKPAFGFYVHPDPIDCRYYLTCSVDGSSLNDCGEGNHFEGGSCEAGGCPDDNDCDLPPNH